MNLKPVELQVAIPRTQEASSIQNQMQHRPTAEQSLLNHHAAKQIEISRQRGEEVDATADGRIRDDGQNGEHKGDDQSRQQRSGSQSENQVETIAAEHPYKGKHIDFSV
ncbi:hypothetical protein NQ117_17480 [Paenibacillus sp. SC116]|uniref:hypothetical protein n=1 Tax=Paenibacillus sp. SC116 TaxID=2968986 RepID=UPI00215B075F|nr:hypothetical protein [Paenibacillus sp. SC116]MCR8845476.1 hypothetical protein [Paenibacillus sp. SC116]